MNIYLIHGNEKRRLSLFTACLSEFSLALLAFLGGYCCERELVVFEAGEFTAGSLRSVSSKAKRKGHVFVGHHFVRIPSAAGSPVPCF